MKLIHGLALLLVLVAVGKTFARHHHHHHHHHHQQTWDVKPDVGRDEHGNVNAGVEVKNKGENHEFDAGWNKVVKGPNKAKPSWHIGGTYRFKRSPDQPWEVQPGANRDENGNVNAGVEVKRKGIQNDFEAGWNKVVHGPNRAKPTWHAGGTFRFRRSPADQLMEVQLVDQTETDLYNL